MGRPRSTFDHVIDRAEWQGDCLVWTGATNVDTGYGQLGWAGQHWTTHRWVMAQTVGDPAGRYVLHSCDNPPCMNPDHLRFGTSEDNMKDVVDRNRHNRKNPPKPPPARPRSRWARTWGRP